MIQLKMHLMMECIIIYIFDVDDFIQTCIGFSYNTDDLQTHHCRCYQTVCRSMAFTFWKFEKLKKSY